MAALRGLSPVALQHQFVPTHHCQSQPYQQVAQLPKAVRQLPYWSRLKRRSSWRRWTLCKRLLCFMSSPAASWRRQGQGSWHKQVGWRRMPPSLLFATHGRQLDARLFRIGPDCHAAASQLLWVRCAAHFLPGFPAPCTFPTCMQGGIPCRRQWTVTASRFSIKGYARQLACG